MCSLGIKPTTFCAADAMLYHWATQEHVSNMIDIEIKFRNEVYKPSSGGARQILSLINTGGTQSR